MTRADRWLAVLLLLLGLSLMGWRVWGNSSQSSRIVVNVKGQTVLSFKMTPGMENKYKIRLERGEAVLEVKDGAVRLEDMEELCLRNICSHTGWIRKNGESIVCVPNNLLIQVIGSEGETVDALSR